MWSARPPSLFHVLDAQSKVVFDERSIYHDDHWKIIAHIAARSLVLKAELRNLRETWEIKVLLSFEDLSCIQCADSMVSHSVDVQRSCLLVCEVRALRSASRFLSVVACLWGSMRSLSWKRWSGSLSSFHRLGFHQGSWFWCTRFLGCGSLFYHSHWLGIQVWLNLSLWSCTSTFARALYGFTNTESHAVTFSSMFLGWFTILWVPIIAYGELW